MSTTRLCLLLTTLWLGGAVAHAQRPMRPLSGEAPTEGIRLDAPSLVDSRDPSGVEVNPASLGFVPSWALLVRHAELKDSGRLGGGGDALLLTSQLPFVSSLRVGLGLQWLRPADAVGYADSVKLSLALALRLGAKASLGLGYHGFIADDDPALDGLQSLDLGLSLRPLEWLGAALVVRNLNTPLYDDLPLQRTYQLEAVARPLRSDRLELGAGVRVGERRAEFDPYLRLELEPLHGLRLGGAVELVRRDFNRDGDSTMDVRGMASLSFNLEQVGLAFSTFLGRGLDPASDGPLASQSPRSTYQGTAVTLRINGRRRPPLFRPTKRLIYLELNQQLGERKWVALVRLLRQIERRDDVAGLLLELDGLQCGWAKAQELRSWLQRLTRAHKQTYAYLRAPGDRQYYIAAAAQRVWLDPGGGVRLDGIGVRTLYLRKLLDKVGVKAQFVRIAEYKSAPEAFTRQTASEAAKRVRTALLDDLFDQLVRALARDRKLSHKQMRAVIDDGPFTPPRAVKAGLVDELVPPGELTSTAQRLSGAQVVRARSLRRAPARWPVGPALAVILVEGDIVRGKSMEIPIIGRKLVGDVTIAQALSKARRSSAVKAVVLRVDSPGGSAMASDTIWRAVRRTAKAKPVVISMGDAAASGGYYVAAAGHEVFAEPATVTGSIGIFTGKFALNRLLDKLGVGVDVAARGKRATMEDFERPYSEQERRFILARLQHYYRAFLRAVAQGRKMSQDRVHELARGRVWSGRQAKQRGLVDRLGGLHEAMEAAARRAGLSPDRPLRVITLPEESGGLLKLLRSAIGSSARTAPSSQLLQPVRPLLRALPPVLLRSQSGEPLARLPYELSID